MCPLFKSNPIRHRACMGFKLGRVADVRQHLTRKHPEEAKKMKSKKGKKRTHRERWNALWDDLFPGQTRPAMPYTGTEVVELCSALMSEYIEQQREEVLSADGETALKGYLAYVKVRSLDMRPGNVSGQGVTDVSEHQTQGTRVQDGTHRHLPLSTNSFDPIMGSFQQPGPRLSPAGYCNTPTLGTTMETQVLPNLESIGPYWTLPANSDAYLSAPTHQLPTIPWVDIGLADGYVDSPVASFDPTSAMHRDWRMTYGGRDASWDFSRTSENGQTLPK